MVKKTNQKVEVDNIEFISAGAGSGKTYALTEQLYNLLISNKVKPANVIATTFTIKAATELRERVRQKLLEKGESRLASQMGEALIGTVNSVCGKLLERFSFEAGLSPELSVIDENETSTLFNQALEANLSIDVIRKMNKLAYRLSQGDQRKKVKYAWRKPIENITKAARANNITPKDLVKMGDSSAKSLLSFFPTRTKKDLDKEIDVAICSALQNIDGQQVGTKKYISLLNQFQSQLNSNNLQWSSWVRLTNTKPTKDFLEFSDEVSSVSGLYDKHPQLHQDLKEYIQSIFIIAANTISHFQQAKVEQGLIDFTDQEQLLLNLLDKKEVIEQLSSEFDLLMVDEFQDTSPIQLALFLKLARCANKVIFVGDIKQSIYAFRGSDPTLMIAVVDAIEHNGGSIKILPKSYRSCKSLVDYTNEVFKQTFSNTLQSNQVELQPIRGNLKSEVSIERWQLLDSNIEKRTHALAGAIKEYVLSGRKVHDNNTNTTRAVQLSDIAIFTRSNDDVDELAATFNQHQIPIQKVQSNLIGTAEATLLIACVRRLIDPKDSLASAEIISLSECVEPEIWLQDRLDYLKLKEKNNKKKKAVKVNTCHWSEDQKPILARLKSFRKKIKLYTPSEIIEYIIIELHLRSIINQWGPEKQHSLQRLNNMDTLITSAQEYESNCQTNGNAATLSGLLLWWNQLNDDGTDEQSMVVGQNAIQIMTYHKSKGLEWPVVILTGLNKQVKTRIWDIRVTTNSSQLDISNPLKDRAIQYWPFPFGGLSKEIPIKENVEESTIGKDSYDKSVEEEKRLLYVAMTRARDDLILTIEKKDTINLGGWLAATEVDWLLPEGKMLSLPNKSRIKTNYAEYEQIDPAKKKITYKPKWFLDYPQLTEKLNASISPSSAESIANAKVGELISIGKRIAIKGSPDMAELGNAIHGVIVAKCINPDFTIEDTAQLIQAMGMNKHIVASDTIQVSDNLIDYINEVYPNSKLYAEYPIQHVLDNGQIVKGWIDLLIETEKGWIICDHKSSPKKLSQLQNIAFEYSGQLKMYADAISEISELPVLSTMIYFPLSGNIASVEPI